MKSNRILFFTFFCQELSRGNEAALGQERERIQVLNLIVGTFVPVHLCTFCSFEPFLPVHLQADNKAEVTRELSRAEEKWGQQVREVKEEGR